MRFNKYFKNISGCNLASKIEFAHSMDNGSSNKPIYALFAHYFTGSKDVTIINRLSRALLKHNIVLFRFDHMGLGQSQGNFADSNFSTNVEDIISAVDFMYEEYKTYPSCLIGHSFGGPAVICAANKIAQKNKSSEVDIMSNKKNINSIITIGSPSDTSHVSHHFNDYIDEINSKGETVVSLSGREFKFKKQFLQDINSQDIDSNISSLNKPIMIMHSPFDNVVSIDHAKKIYELAKHPKNFISLDNTDHLVSKNNSDVSYIADMIVPFIKRYHASCN
ncbi:MAG TPA: alpha/beta hydrolase [Candidatus Megaira endosymbiont of Hartmannula sinica]|nr:alpha/beta hydrolase [Candidatus Megaera endosymbiont of Hartmannula sinica]